MHAGGRHRSWVRGASRAIAIVACLSAVLAAPAAAAPTAITEYPVEVGHSPNIEHLTVGPDGALWFGDGYWPEGAYHALLGRFEPATGAFAEFDQGLGQFSVIRDFVAGPDGNLWFADSGSAGTDAAIGKITAAGQITEYGVAGTPRWIIDGPESSLWFSGGTRVGRATTSGTTGSYELPNGTGELAEGPDGHVWFTYGSGATAKIGRVERQPDETTEITLFHAGLGPHSVPERMVAADGYLWFNDLSGTEPAIGRVAADGEITEFRAGLAADSSIIDIAAGPDGNLWFTDAGAGAIGRITPEGQITEYTDEGIGSFEYYRNEVGFPLQHLVAGPDGNMWFTIPGGSAVLGKITPGGQITTFYPGEDGLSYGARPQELASGQHGELWFDANSRDPATGTEGQTIGRIVPGDDTKVPGTTPSPSGGGAWGLPIRVPNPWVVVRGSRVLKADRHGKLLVRVSCSISSVPCSGRLQLTFPPSPRVVASAAFSIMPTASMNLSLRLDRRARDLLASGHRRRGELSLVGLSNTSMNQVRVSVRASRPAR